MTGTWLTHGADTPTLREHGDHLRESARRLDSLAHELGRSVLVTTWDGSDAEAFRARWLGISPVITLRSTHLASLAARLDTDADEQDEASAVESDGSASSAAKPLAPASGKHSDETDEDRDIDVEDFEHRPGKEGSQTVTITLPDGSTVEVSRDGDGSESLSMGEELAYETEVSAGPVEVSAGVTVGSEFEVTAHPDGSVTYTFTATAGLEAEGEVDVRAIEVEVGVESMTEAVYSVTVPPGTSFEDAVQINPFNPESIIEGASITLGAGVENTARLEVEGTYRGVDLGIEFEASIGTEHTTVITRDPETGNLSVLTGPGESVSMGSTLMIGVEDFSVQAGNSTTNESSVLEYTEFAEGAAGNAAYIQMMQTSSYPVDTAADGVVDRYTQTSVSTSSAQTIGVEIEDLFTYESSTTAFSDELIVREYPDGEIVWAQQVLPHGEGSENSVLVTGGSEQETAWQMTLGDVPAGDVEAVTEAYWGSPHRGGDLQLTFTAEELAVMAENRGLSHGDVDHYSDPTDYLSSVVATASGADADIVLLDVYRDFVLHPTEAGTWNGAEPATDPSAPGVLESAE